MCLHMHAEGSNSTLILGIIVTLLRASVAILFNGGDTPLLIREISH